MLCYGYGGLGMIKTNVRVGFRESYLYVLCCFMRGLKRFIVFAKRSCNSLDISFNHQHCHRLLHSAPSAPSSFSRFLVGKEPKAIADALALAENSKSVILGAEIHAFVVKLGSDYDVFTKNNVIKSYMKCGSLDDGLKLFDEMPERNVVSWTLLVSGALQCGEVELGLEMFVEMIGAGFLPNEFALCSVMKACSNDMELGGFGLCVHCFALKIGTEKSHYVGCSILSFYAKLGDVEAAEYMFNGMLYIDHGCWNAMIGGYAQCGCGLEAMSIVSLMRHEGMMMDQYTFISALQGCSLLGDLNFGKQIHGLIIRNGVEFSTSTMNALMDMYFKNGETMSAWKVFKKINDKDVVTWNTVFSSFSHYEDPREAASLFHNFMLADVRPNGITFSILFRECGELQDLDLGFQFYCLVIHFGFSDKTNVTSSLIHMFSRCGVMEMARLVFDGTVLKSIVLWNALIAGYNMNSCDSEALNTFCNLLQLGGKADDCTFSNILEICYMFGRKHMTSQLHGILVKSAIASHAYVCCSLIKVYAKLGLVDDSFKIFKGLDKPDMASWSAMISAFVHHGYNYEAMRCLNSLFEAGEKPDEFVLGSILNSCAGFAFYYQTRSIHAFIIKFGFDHHVFVASAILDAYAKCGDIKGARMAFDQSLKFNDIVVHNAMIMAYAHHGLFVEVMDIFNKIKLANLQPTQATFVSLLSACGHIGFVDQGWSLFESMGKEYGMKPSPDIYCCLIDMFSRNGYLEDAKSVIEMMPYPPGPAIFRSLLSGCRTYGNKELGVWVANKLLQLVPENDAAYALLFKLYSEGGSWEDAAEVGRKMIERGLIKEAGQSWVEW